MTITYPLLLEYHLSLYPSVPHPSENHIHLRVQMYGGLLPQFQSCSSLLMPPFEDNELPIDALLKALQDLDDLCETIDTAYQHSLRTGNYDRWDEKS